MWDNEKIFSVGDLSGSREEYTKFIDIDYNASYKDRFHHVLEMIKCLNYEKDLIMDIYEEYYPHVSLFE